jgi:hypothetical protein
LWHYALTINSDGSARVDMPCAGELDTRHCD